MSFIEKALEKSAKEREQVNTKNVDVEKALGIATEERKKVDKKDVSVEKAPEKASKERKEVNKINIAVDKALEKAAKRLKKVDQENIAVDKALEIASKRPKKVDQGNAAVEKALGTAAKERKKVDEKPVDVIVPYVKESFDGNKVDEHIVSYYDSIGKQTWTKNVPVMECFRRLRLKMRSMFDTNSYKVFTFVSASQGEGKSTVTLNAAITLSQDINCRVVVVDADLRRPTIHSFLGLRPRKGLVNLLNNETTIGDVVMETFIPRLSILPAGDKPRNTCELLTSKKMEEIIATLKSQYDFVIIDTPPVLAFSETASICRLADGVILVIQVNHTKKRPVKRALDLLQDCNVLGFVMNKEAIMHSGYYGHVYY